MPLSCVAKQEWLKEQACPMTTHTSKVTFYELSGKRNKITSAILREAVKHVADHHLNLRSNIGFVLDDRYANGKTDQVKYKLKLIQQEAPISIRKINLKTDELFNHPQLQNKLWEKILQEELNKKFASNEPLWRVIHVKGQTKGQIIAIFHHAVVDGIFTSEVMNELYENMARLLDKKRCEVKQPYLFPKMKELYRDIWPKSTTRSSISVNRKSDEEKFVDSLKTETQFYPTHHTKHILDTALTQHLITWSHAKRVRMNAVILSALMQAVYDVKKPTEPLIPISIFSLRKFYKNIEGYERELPPNIAGTNFTGKLHSPYAGEMDFISFAQTLDKDLHEFLKTSMYKYYLKSIAENVKSMPPKEILENNLMHENMVCLSNIGKQSFDGIYKDSQGAPLLHMTEMFAASNAALATKANNYTCQVLCFGPEEEERTFIVLGAPKREEFNSEVPKRIVERMEEILKKETAYPETNQ